MKLNLDYYKKEQDTKQISEEYEEVLEKVQKCKDDDFSKMLEPNSKIKNILALSEIRENILNWYPFKENSTILEMNANYGEITGLLCKKAIRVTSIEESPKYAEIIEKRHKNRENLELYVGKFSNIELKEKFDYVVILGKTENLELAIDYAKEHLKENGRILLAVNNKFGVKAWITTKEESKVINNDKIAISRENLDKILQGMNCRYYYPLPDYNMPNIIYTENTLPNVLDIYRDLTYKDENVNFKEVEGYKEIIKNNPKDFNKFANSFLIEISNTTIEDNDIRFITFSNIRKDKYRIKTIVRKEYVEKTSINAKAEAHIENIKNNIEILNQIGIKTLDSYENGKVISKYTDSKTLEDVLIDTFKNNGKEEFLKKIEDYKNYIQEKLEIVNSEDDVFTKYGIEVAKEIKERLNFVKHGLWDLIFQNCFVIENEYVFYDQEWYEENIPVEYILYRAILYFTTSKQYITDEEIFKFLNIREFVPIFKILDDKIQEKIRKQLMWNIHTKEELQKNKYNRAKEQIKQKDKEILELKNEIENLKNSNEQKDNILKTMENSLSWRITKPLRKLRGH